MSSIADLHSRLWQEMSATDGEHAVASRIEALVDASLPLASAGTRARAVTELVARVSGLGPLQALADDPAVSEIMVNAGEVWVERSGRLEPADLELTVTEVEHLVRRLAARVGRRIDRSSPAVDVRLEDGSRLHAVIPPVAVDGPMVTIRRFAIERPGLDALVSGDALELLADAVETMATIVVAGGTSTGKTTLLNALGELLAPDERIITIEEAAELQLPGRHVIRLETRAASEGVGPIGLRDLIRHALRMRPDRIICGEMRGAETLDLVQAMNTGHRGSLSTLHANTPADALRRMETMMLLGDADLPLPAIREQLSSCVDLVVMMARHPDGARRVTSIAEVGLASDGTWKPQVLHGAPVLASATGVR